jgi:threonine dehydrogenase-like Zn-dependent dehydrogenase
VRAHGRRLSIGACKYSHTPVATLHNSWTMQRDTEVPFDTLESGRLKVAHAVSHCELVERAPEAYRLLLEERRSAMGATLT